MRIGLESFYRAAGSNEGLANLVAGANAGSKEANNCLVRGQLLEGIRDSLVCNGLMTQSRDALGRDKITWGSDEVEKFFRDAEARLYGDDNGAVRDDVATADLDNATVRQLLDRLVELQGGGKDFSGFSKGVLGPNEERLLKEIANLSGESKCIGLGMGSDGLNHVVRHSDLAGSNALREQILQIAKNVSASGEPLWHMPVMSKLGIPPGRKAADCREPLSPENLADVIKLFEGKFGKAGTWGAPMPRQEHLDAPGVTDAQRKSLRNLDRKNLETCLGVGPKTAKALSVDTIAPFGENGLLLCVLRGSDGRPRKVLCDREGVVFSYEDYKKAAFVLWGGVRPENFSDEKLQACLTENFSPLDFVDHREMADIAKWLGLLDEGLRTVGSNTFAVPETFLAMLSFAIPKARALQGQGPITLPTLAKALHLEIASDSITPASFAAAVQERILKDSNYSHPGLPEDKTGLSHSYTFRTAVRSGFRYCETLLANRYKLGFSRESVYRDDRDFKLPDEYGRMTAEELKTASHGVNWQKCVLGSHWHVGGQKMQCSDDRSFDGIVDSLGKSKFNVRQIAALMMLPHAWLYAVDLGFGGNVLLLKNTEVSVTRDGDRMKAVYFIEWKPQKGESVPDHAKFLRYEATINPDGTASCADQRLVSEAQKADELANPGKKLRPVPHFTPAQAETIVYSKGLVNPTFAKDGKTVLCEVLGSEGKAPRQVAILEDGSVKEIRKNEKIERNPPKEPADLGYRILAGIEKFQCNFSSKTDLTKDGIVGFVKEQGDSLKLNEKQKQELKIKLAFFLAVQFRFSDNDLETVLGYLQLTDENPAVAGMKKHLETIRSPEVDGFAGYLWLVAAKDIPEVCKLVHFLQVGAKADQKNDMYFSSSCAGILSKMLPAALEKIRQTNKKKPITLQEWVQALGLDKYGLNGKTDWENCANSDFYEAFKRKVKGDFQSVLDSRKAEGLDGWEFDAFCSTGCASLLKYEAFLQAQLGKRTELSDSDYLRFDGMRTEGWAWTQAGDKKQTKAFEEQLIKDLGDSRQIGVRFYVNGEKKPIFTTVPVADMDEKMKKEVIGRFRGTKMTPRQLVTLSRVMTCNGFTLASQFGYLTGYPYSRIEVESLKGGKIRENTDVRVRMIVGCAKCGLVLEAKRSKVTADSGSRVVQEYVLHPDGSLKRGSLRFFHEKPITEHPGWAPMELQLVKNCPRATLHQRDAFRYFDYRKPAAALGMEEGVAKELRVGSIEQFQDTGLLIARLYVGPKGKRTEHEVLVNADGAFISRADYDKSIAHKEQSSIKME